ncbi:MAG: replication factor C large subunit [Candidatus Micrarchaeaceae archaeon]
MLLYEKYTPYTLNGIVGNAEARAKIRAFGEEVLAGKKPTPLMLYGPCGTGKTIAAKALANTFGFGLILLTASDYRDADTLEKKILPAAVSRGLFNKISLIVFDEIDELSNQFDKGAQSAIVRIVTQAKQPIVFISNDFWDQRIAFLRSYVEKVEFKKISSADVLGFIANVAKKEKASISKELLEEISNRCNGDMRAALNDLEFAIGSTSNVLDYLVIRNQKIEIFGVLDKIFFSNSFGTAKSAFENSDVDFDMLVKWIDENIPNRYAQRVSLESAYDSLAKASAYANIASRISQYSLLRYSSVLASAGVSTASMGFVKRLGSYSFPKQVKYLSSTKQERLLLNGIALKLAKLTHSSRKEIIIDFLPFFEQALAAKAKKFGKGEVMQLLESELGLSETEANFLLG